MPSKSENLTPPTQSPASESSTARRVFALPELLVAIILGLPLQDILVNAQRVNYNWQAVVKSQAVQQALFFSPSASCEQPTFNQLLQKAFPPWFGPRTTQSHGLEHRFQELAWASSPRSCDAYARKEASWRHMLVVQPPAMVFEIVKTRHFPRSKIEKTGSVRFENGVRMGTLYDFAQRAVARDGSRFQMQWHMFASLEEESIDGKWESKAGAGILESKCEEEMIKAQVTLRTDYYFTCVERESMDPHIGREFVSKGFQELEVFFVESRTGR